MRLTTCRAVAIAGPFVVAGAVALGAVATTGVASIAQEPTPAGRLGGGAPLDATIPVATAPPTATATGAPASPTAVASPIGSPVASPVAGEALMSAACTVAPRSLDDVAALLSLTEPPAAPDSPTAAAWTPDAQAAATSIVAELVACGDAGSQLAAYALLTDAALVEYLVGSQPRLSAVRALFFDDRPALVPARIAGLETRAAEPGVIYLRLDFGGGMSLAARLSVAQERGAWRVAGIVVED